MGITIWWPDRHCRLPEESDARYASDSTCLQVDESQQPVSKKQQQAEAFNGNAVKWALMKADESLDEIEENPPEAVKAIYDISRGPVGEREPCSHAGICNASWPPS